MRRVIRTKHEVLEYHVNGVRSVYPCCLDRYEDMEPRYTISNRSGA